MASQGEHDGDYYEMEESIAVLKEEVRVQHEYTNRTRTRERELGALLKNHGELCKKTILLQMTNSSVSKFGS